MLLHDIGKSPNALFKKINYYLEANYGFKLSESVGDADLNSIKEQIEGEILDLRIKGENSELSPEISKRLLVLEGIRNLREYAHLGDLKSPKLDFVIDGLVDFVINSFELSGTCSDDLEKSLCRAMDEYRSSKYRFPDDYIEQRVREKAYERLQGVDMGHAHDQQQPLEIIGDPEMNTASGADTLGRYIEEGTDQGDQGEEAEVEVDAEIDEMQDAGKTDKSQKLEGIEMNENLVKHLRTLLETEVSRAEVMMAAKGFAQELQEMIEKIGRLQNEDLPPVSDQMRETYGADSAMAFQTQIAGALQSVMDSLYAAKSQVDDAVSSMALTGQVTAAVDMDKDIDAAADVAMDADLDNIGDEIDALPDEFGADASEEPLGRAKKQESVEKMEKKISEMKKLVAKARNLREATLAQKP